MLIRPSWIMCYAQDVFCIKMFLHNLFLFKLRFRIPHFFEKYIHKNQITWSWWIKESKIQVILDSFSINSTMQLSNLQSEFQNSFAFSRYKLATHWLRIDCWLRFQEWREILKRWLQIWNCDSWIREQQSWSLIAAIYLLILKIWVWKWYIPKPPS